jgi:hypothetical protein
MTVAMPDFNFQQFPHVEVLFQTNAWCMAHQRSATLSGGFNVSFTEVRGIFSTGSRIFLMQLTDVISDIE